MILGILFTVGVVCGIVGIVMVAIKVKNEDKATTAIVTIGICLIFLIGGMCISYIPGESMPNQIENRQE